MVPNGKVAFSLSKPALAAAEVAEKRKFESVFEKDGENRENPNFGAGEPENSKLRGRNPENLNFGERNPRNSQFGDPNSRDKKEINGGKASEGPAALAELMKEQERAKDKMNRKDYWLTEGIVVKVTSKGLAEKGYYKQKGVVIKVIEKYVGEIKMIETGHVLRVDQEELETVIPQIGGIVRIVNGAYRGCNARIYVKLHEFRGQWEYYESTDWLLLRQGQVLTTKV
ncbi:hypothetical protein SUGI_1182020 [Cryptomeria japonica]|nr:hypothetical protein SUGI_1182020 [Cryptomeria japonica]